ncbi:amylo-alpha-1,6-glucosidase [Desulfonatronum thioautotrophicum]|uniref:amylo-alpha-1,6-glucosidase n=1 Tax=Desulfonatronum thioautotrophicum TaxID=617001 RepID=UPI00069B0733|nr:amylo-alpha-1,6-glucosidase [Desulfonatronum thioautotrophicum]
MTRAPSLVLDQEVLADLDRSSRLEWLETNGLGGWAGSTVSGAHTRRYHGLLVAATRPPGGRMVLLSRLDEALIIADQRHELECNFYPGAVHPHGYASLQGFTRDFFPRFTYAAGGVELRKTVVAVHGENTTLVLYEAVAAPAPFILELQPFIAGRDYHALVTANGAIRQSGNFQEGVFRVQPYAGVPELFLNIPGATFHPDPQWYFRFEYPAEGERGLDQHEDLFTHGVFRLWLRAGERIGVIVSTQDPTGRDAFGLQEFEQQRRENLLHALPRNTPVTDMLALAADQFLVQRSDGMRTILAGYHWFTDWGRDTLISLPGITLTLGRRDAAREILATSAAAVSQGMLPNRFSEDNDRPEYNTVDAALWFFVAAYHFHRHAGTDPSEQAFLRDVLLPTMVEIVEWHERGTRFGIRVDRDGLLHAGEPGVQLTWMDAKVGDWVVTPRQGKAVEINALWYNALCILARFQELFALPAKALETWGKAERARRAFNRLFWNAQEQRLDDVVNGADRDTALRPNQILAIGLPHALLSKTRAEAVLKAVKRDLLTPCGLRTLDPNDPAYRPRYEGGPLERDGGYHQGTVWPWLLGPYCTALIRFDGHAGRQQAARILEHIRGHFLEAGIGTVSEICDGQPPHAPRGCIAQAWSVAELLRVLLDEIGPTDLTDLAKQNGIPTSKEQLWPTSPSTTTP